MPGNRGNDSPPPSRPQPAGPRIAREKRTMRAMLRIYCDARHGGGEALCEECARLLDYAERRLDKCPFAEEKPACNRCEVHCYSAVMRERVRQVMRYAGPRMLLRHPVLAIRHLLDARREPPRLAARSRRR